MSANRSPILPFDAETLFERLLRATEAAGAGSLSPPELEHLVGVVTRCSALLTDVYTDQTLRAILADDPRRLARLVAMPWFRLPVGDDLPSALHRLRRLPDGVRGVGDKALFDVAITGLQQVRGVPLDDLGPRAYRLASEVLELLADDARLREHFVASRLGSAIEDEVQFLRRCSERFELYSQLLRFAGDDEPGPASRRLPAAPVASPPERHPVPAPFVPPGVPAPPRRRPRLFGDADYTRERLLGAYERLLLFAGLDLERLRGDLSGTVVDQDEAIATLIDDFALFAVGTQPLTKPASYFLVGPTGVGKNYLVETLAAQLARHWRVEVPLLTIEGPNYTYPSDINELRGATRGFIRSDEPGLLTEFHERAARAPLSIILVDEVEKAHPQLIRFFLSILDRGTTTDAHGNELSFEGALVFFTSNIGYDERHDTAHAIGFGGEKEHESAYQAGLGRSLRRVLPPEFINRVKMVRFQHLPRSSAERILDLEFERIAARYRDVHGIELVLAPAGREALLAEGYSHEYGARHLAAVLQRSCNVEVGKMLRRDEAGAGGAAARRRDPSGLLERLRFARASGGGVDDLGDLDREILEAARARVTYRRIVVSAESGAVVYRREP